MRRITSTLLIAVLVFQMAGTWGIFQCRRMQVRKEVKREIKLNLAQRSNTTFVFDSEEWASLEWFTDDEFRMDGHMYDLVRVTPCPDGSVEALCLPDTEETTLHAMLADACRKAMQDDPAAGPGRAQPWTLIYLPVAQTELVIPSSRSFRNSLESPIPSSWVASADAPPPRRG
jgi:hypothetical protein